MTDQPDARYPSARAYRGPEITVLYDRDRCVHFAECVRGLPSVFDVSQKPWIQPGNALPDELADVIERCPSGALHYELADRAEAPDAPTSIVQNDRGQILLRGDLQLVGETGAAPLADTRMSLCGCGRSAGRPFCDQSCDAPG